METPNKMIGGIAGAMAQQPGAMTGVLGGTTNLGVQAQQGAASVAPQQPPSVFNNNENLVGQKMFGQNVPGQYDKIISPLGKIDPTKKGHASVKSLTAQKKYNDQLRKQQADKASKKTFTKTSGTIEKVPQFSFTAVKRDLPRIDAIPQDQKNKS